MAHHRFSAAAGLFGGVLLCACPASTPSPGRPAAGQPAAVGPAATVEVLRGASGVVVRIRPAAGARERPQLFAGATLGRSRQRPKAVLFGLSASGQRWRYEGCGELAFEIDGAPPMTLPAEREAQIGRGTLTEVLIAPVPLETVERLARAGSSTLVACGERLVLDAADLALLRRFLARLRAELA